MLRRHTAGFDVAEFGAKHEKASTTAAAEDRIDLAGLLKPILRKCHIVRSSLIPRTHHSEEINQHEQHEDDEKQW